MKWFKTDTYIHIEETLRSGCTKSPSIQSAFNFSYFKKSIFLVSPANLVRFTAEFLKTALKVSSVISSQSFFVSESKSGCGLKSGSRCGLEKRFHGQTSWHTSHPKAQSLKLPFISLGIFSLSSIVKYDMHLLPSTT